jgi:hypothetical protein
MHLKLIESEHALAVREREWAEELGCRASVCGSCTACEKHELRRQFEVWDTTEGMMPRAGGVEFRH